MTDIILRDAHLSPCEKYRYDLVRLWGPAVEEYVRAAEEAHWPTPDFDKFHSWCRVGRANERANPGPMALFCGLNPSVATCGSEARWRRTRDRPRRPKRSCLGVMAHNGGSTPRKERACAACHERQLVAT